MLKPAQNPIAAATAGFISLVALPLSAQTAEASRSHVVVAPSYVTAASPGAAATVDGVPIIRVYRDLIPFTFGEDRDSRTLEALGKVLGEDWFSHPVSDCKLGIPADTDVVLFSSNPGAGDSFAQQNSAECQGALTEFLDRGGRLIIGMADYDQFGGYVAPGADGRPSPVGIGPGECVRAALTPAADGPDGVPGTADDHPLVFGPDRLPATADDLASGKLTLTEERCNAPFGGDEIAIGGLDPGVSVPDDAVSLIANAVVGSIHAEYCFGAGRVIASTMTMESRDQNPDGLGPSNYLLALYSYALSADAACAVPPPPTIAVSVDVKPGSCENPLNVNAKGVLPVAIASSAVHDVSQIDLATVTLAGVPALSGDLADVATADACAASGDGVADLRLAFDNAAVGGTIVEADGGTVLLPLAGHLKAEFGGTAIRGEDMVRVIRKR